MHQDSLVVGQETAARDSCQTPDTFLLSAETTSGKPIPVGLPTQEAAFSMDTLWRASQVQDLRTGVEGHPKPYTIAGDNLMNGLLLACFICALLSFQRSRNFVIKQFKHFFYPSYSNREIITETWLELRFQLFFAAQTCLLLGIIYFFFTQPSAHTGFVIPPFLVILTLSATVFLYFLLKTGLYFLVNLTFFDGKKNEQWIKHFLFLFSFEGVVLYPIVLLQVYMQIGIVATCAYTILMVVLFKILTIYKYFNIFFPENGLYVPKILYLCAVEIVPLSLIYMMLGVTSDVLKVNF